MLTEAIPGESGQPTILILATNKRVRRLLAAAAAGLDLQPVHSDCAVEAIETIDRRAPRLVVVDLEVPGNAALTLCQHLQSAGTIDLPVLALGAATQTRHLSDLLDAGAADFVTAPLSAAVLELRLRHLLGGARVEGRPGASGMPPDVGLERDPLTGLVTRQLFTDRLDHALARAERGGCRVSLMHLDVDHFRAINDSLGRALGDDLLRQVAARLEICLRATDTVARADVPHRPALMRSGGDEFMLVIDSLETDTDPANVATRIVAELARPFRLGAAEVVVSASVGIALFPDDGVAAGTLMRHAETALELARSGGGNAFVFYNKEMNSDAAARLELASRLRQAQSERQFELVYQPILDCKSRRVRSVEALLRWNDPERGTLLPHEFLPLAEETGMTVPLGDWVIEQACSQWRRWIEQGIGPVEISVNVSERQFREPGFVERTERSLRDYGVDSSFLAVEVTEGVLMNTALSTTSTVEQLQQAGIGIQVDRFGTGRTSLGALWRLPAEALKIDRSFIVDLPDNPHNCSLVAAIVAMAHKLRLQVVAVGVETEAQLRFLRALGCEQVQGFLLGKPAKGAQLDELLGERLVRHTQTAVIPFRRRSAS